MKSTNARLFLFFVVVDVLGVGIGGRECNPAHFD